MEVKESISGSNLGRWIVQHTRLDSIKGKIFVIFIMTFLFIGGLSALHFWNLDTVKERMILSQQYDDLLNNILELRRMEKNFFIYGGRESLKESRQYIEHINKLVDSLADDLPVLVGQKVFRRFQSTLNRYNKQVELVLSGEPLTRKALRVLGKELTDSAEQFRHIKRERIHKAISRSSILPFAFLGIFLFLMILVIKIIALGLLRPLDVVKATTQQVARGDFSPIRYKGKRLEEIYALIEAFNRMAQELETNHEDLVQTRKIAAIGTLTAGVAHELNNPINNISLTAEAFGEIYGDAVDEEGQDMLRDILSQTARAADIVKNLLDFSRTERPVFAHLAPANVMDSSIALVKNQFRIAGVYLETSITDDLPPIAGNLRNLQQVFTNLLLNAVQASPQEGTVKVCVELADDQQHIRFSVKDSGPGIAPEIRQQIFEPFFSTKQVGKGTGLGLAVSFSIIKRHYGRIDVKGKEGEGAEFIVLLPCVSEQNNVFSNSLRSKA
ncbi:sensor histidine kinase [Halodesulfovibrio aestuarii]|uniref:histidine kinase n=1 Tax=Halodesulfovibrio aestuarii TaxID=126333 RepID=A0ABV4JTT6_9BACT